MAQMSIKEAMMVVKIEWATFNETQDYEIYMVSE